MKVDAHQHFWKYSKKTHSWISNEMKDLQTNHLPEDLKPILDKVGIDGTIAIQANQTEEENKFLLNLASKHDWIKGIVGWTDLKKKSSKKAVEKLAGNAKFKGFRHNIQHARDPRYILNQDFNQGVSYLKDFDLVFEILIYQKQMVYATEFVQRHPYTKLVLNDMAKPLIKQGEINPWEKNIREMAHCENLYCKISGLFTLANKKNWSEKDFKPYLDVVLEAFGPERIIFGSDWPISKLAAPYEKAMGLVTKYIKKLSKDEQAAIMGGNACEVYNL